MHFLVALNSLNCGYNATKTFIIFQRLEILLSKNFHTMLNDVKDQNSMSETTRKKGTSNTPQLKFYFSNLRKNEFIVMLN